MKLTPIRCFLSASPPSSLLLLVLVLVLYVEKLKRKNQIISYKVGYSIVFGLHTKLSIYLFIYFFRILIRDDRGKTATKSRKSEKSNDFYEY